MYMNTNPNQFGFKRKHGKDQRIYVLKEIYGRIRLVKFRPTMLGSAHFRTVKMLLTEAGQSNGKFCPRSKGKHGDTTNKFNLFN